MSNAYRIIVTLPKADGFHHRDDHHRARIVADAIEEGLRDRYTETDCITIEEVPPPQDRATLPVGARVLVTPFSLEQREPFAARICGYDMHRTKYRLDREYDGGGYSTGGHYWSFVGQTEPHPDNKPA